MASDKKKMNNFKIKAVKVKNINNVTKEGDEDEIIIRSSPYLKINSCKSRGFAIRKCKSKMKNKKVKLGKYGK